jgi:hypothetical protein
MHIKYDLSYHPSEWILFQDVRYDVEFFLTGDMKFIQLVKGLQGATSIFSCPICTKPKTLKRGPDGVIPVGGFRCCCDFDEEVDHPDCTHWKGPGPMRSQALSDRLHGFSDPYVHLGFHREAPLKSIDWDHIIPDILHFHLRVTDVLYGGIFESVRSTCDPSDAAALTHVENMMMKEFTRASKQEFRIYRKSENDILSSNVNFSSLWNSNRVTLGNATKSQPRNPPQRKYIGSCIQLGNILPVDQWPFGEHWQAVMEDLSTLYATLSSVEPLEETTLTELQLKMSNLTERIRFLVSYKKVTPYMHVMEAHLEQLLRMTGFLSLGAFSCQSLEKKNSHQSSVLFRCTMKGGGAGTGDRTDKILRDIFFQELVLNFSCCERNDSD